MNKYSEIKELIRKNAGTYGGNGTFFTAKISGVTGNTCKAKIGDLELTGIRLLSVAEGSDNGILITPKVGSIVTVADFGKDLRDLQVVGYADVESITIMGGANGGLTITPELKKQLDKMTARIDGIIDAIKNAVPVPQDGGAGLQTTMIAGLQAITQTEDFSHIENKKITH